MLGNQPTFVLFSSILLSWAIFAHGEEPTITADKAREYDGKMVAITMKVKNAKNLMDKKLVYLDSEEDYKSEKNIAIVLPKETLEELKKQNIEDAAEYYKGKTIKVTGRIRVKDKATRLYVNDASQISVVEEKSE